MVNFSEWLDGVLKERNWTRAELSRRSGVSQSTFSMIYKGDRNVGPEVASAISGALAIEERVVFQAAGLLPPTTEEDEIDREINYLLSQVTEDQKKNILSYARFIAFNRGGNERPATNIEKTNPGPA